MRLSVHTDYALRMLMLLALEPTERFTIAEVASRYGISRDHLMKVALTLTRAGFLDSVRGRGGGLSLSRAPAKITVGQVVRATESDLALVECFDPERNQCVIAPACGLRHALGRAQQAFLDSLDSVTLADLLGPPTGLRTMRSLLQRASP